MIHRNGITAGWGSTGDRHVILLPNGYKPGTKPGVIWCAPYESGAANVLFSGIGSWMAQWGYPVVCLDLGQSRIGGVSGSASEWNGSDGPELFTADAPMAAIDTIWNTVFPAIGALSGPGVGKCYMTGGSGGGCKAVQWTRLHPDRVAACLTIIGVVNLLELQQRSTEALPRVWEWLTPLGNPVPNSRNPRYAYEDWTPAHPPLRMQYSLNDTICPWTETVGLANDINAVGGSAIAIEQNQGNHDFYTGLNEEAAHWLLQHSTSLV